MKKFSSILENKSVSLLSKLNSSEDDIRDMCHELTDNDYSIDFDDVYLGMDGHSYYTTGETTVYYPYVSIRLYRKMKEEDGDVRNWDGGVYYDGNGELLRTVYEIYSRLESTYKSDTIDVYFSIRSINEVNFRIYFTKVIGEAKLEFAKLFNEIGGFNVNDDHYEFDVMSSGDGRNIIGDFKLRPGSINYNDFRDNILSNNNTDIVYLDNLMKNYTKSLFDKTKGLTREGSTVTFKLLGSDVTYDFMSKISVDNKDVCLINATYDVTREVNVTVAKGIFRDNVQKVTLHKVSFKVTLKP